MLKGCFLSLKALGAGLAELLGCGGQTVLSVLSGMEVESATSVCCQADIPLCSTLLALNSSRLI